MKAEDFEKLLGEYRHAVLDLDVLTEIEKPDSAEVEMEQAARQREQTARRAILAAFEQLLKDNARLKKDRDFYTDGRNFR